MAYYIVFLSLVMWSLFAFVTIHELSVKQREYAKLINISGKQRMLSQRLALMVTTLEHNESVELRARLEQALNDLSANHFYILSHMPSSKIAKLYNNEPHSINNKLSEYVHFIRNYDRRKSINGHEELYMRASAVLLEFDYAVSVFQDESIVFVNQFDLLEKFILGGSLATIVFEAIFLILPILRRSEEYVLEIEKQRGSFGSMLSTSKDGIAMFDLSGNFTFANNAFLQTVGYQWDELIGQNYVKVCPKKSCYYILEMIDQLLKNSFIENIEEQCVTKDNKKIILSISAAIMPDSKHMLISTKNITESKRLARQNLEYIKLVDENVINSSTDLVGIITYVSDAFCKISEYSRNELIGSKHSIVRHLDMPRELFEEMWTDLKAGKSWSGEIKNATKNGGFYWIKTKISPIFDEDGKKCGYTAIRQDITDKKLIEQISMTDRLTGLYNRFRLDEIFVLEFEKALRYKNIFSIILIDVDYFKKVNDEYGHLTGDYILVEIASILRAHTRKSDTLGRWGGEEFLIVAPEADNDKAAKLAEKLRMAVADHFFKDVGSKTISLGLTSYRVGDKIEDMLRRADQALYEAKKNGRNRTEII